MPQHLFLEPGVRSFRCAQIGVLIANCATSTTKDRRLQEVPFFPWLPATAFSPKADMRSRCGSPTKRTVNFFTSRLIAGTSSPGEYVARLIGCMKVLVSPCPSILPQPKFTSPYVPIRTMNLSKAGPWCLLVLSLRQDTNAKRHRPPLELTLHRSSGSAYSNPFPTPQNLTTTNWSRQGSGKTWEKIYKCLCFEHIQHTRLFLLAQPRK